MNNNKALSSVPKLKADADLTVIYGSDTQADMELGLSEITYSARRVDQLPVEPGTTIAHFPRVFVNGFPKSGTHMLWLYILGLARPVPEKPWLSSWQPTPWHTGWADLDLIGDVIHKMEAGTSIMGHMGYHPHIRDIFEAERINHVFIYRSLRDVAVSAAHHVLTPKEHSNLHPGKDYYQSLPDFESVLIAIIEGTDEYPGLIQRWRYYLPWLADDLTLAIPYEYCLRLPGQACRDIIAYHYRQAAMWYGLELEFDEDKLLHAGRMLARHAQATHMSATYRVGKVGEWEKFWTADVERAFRRAGGHRWDAKK